MKRHYQMTTISVQKIDNSDEKYNDFNPYRLSYIISLLNKHYFNSYNTPFEALLYKKGSIRF